MKAQGEERAAMGAEAAFHLGLVKHALTQISRAMRPIPHPTDIPVAAAWAKAGLKNLALAERALGRRAAR